MIGSEIMQEDVYKEVESMDDLTRKIESLRGAANRIWVSIEENMSTLYSDIDVKLEDDRDDEMLNELDSIFSVMRCSTNRIQRIIEMRLSYKDEILNLLEMDEIIEIIEAIKYYSNEKINEFRNTTIFEDKEKLIYYLILYRSVIIELQSTCNYLKERTISIAIK